MMRRNCELPLSTQTVANRRSGVLKGDVGLSRKGLKSVEIVGRQSLRTTIVRISGSHS